jgi:hypothetical protein
MDQLERFPNVSKYQGDKDAIEILKTNWQNDYYGGYLGKSLMFKEKLTNDWKEIPNGIKLEFNQVSR